MASACLYLDIDENGISGHTGPGREDAARIRINYADLPEEDGTDVGLTAALTLLGSDSDISACKQAVVTLPPDWVWFRYTALPFGDKKKLGQILPLELSASYPDQDQEVLLDFHVSDPSTDGDPHLVFTGTIPEARVAQIFTALSGMGISPVVITPRGLAQAMAFSELQTDIPDFLFIHRTDTDTTLTLIKEGFPLMVRSLKPSASGDVQHLAREIHVTLAGTGLRAGLAPEALKDLPILLSGLGLAPDEETVERLASALETVRPEGTSPITHLPQVPWEKKITADQQPPHLVNFCVGIYRTDSFWQRYKGQLIATLVMVILVFGLGVWDLHRKNTDLEARINQVRDTSMAVYKRTFPKAGKAPVHAPLMLMESKVKQARRSRSGPNTSALPAAPNARVMEIIHELSSKIPAAIDMEITRLTLNHDRLIITGLTANFNHVDKIKGLVQASPHFKNVSIQSAEADKTGKQVRFKFILEI